VCLPPISSDCLVSICIAIAAFTILSSLDRTASMPNPPAFSVGCICDDYHQLQTRRKYFSSDPLSIEVSTEFQPDSGCWWLQSKPLRLARQHYSPLRHDYEHGESCYSYGTGNVTPFCHVDISGKRKMSTHTGYDLSAPLTYRRNHLEMESSAVSCSRHASCRVSLFGMLVLFMRDSSPGNKTSPDDRRAIKLVYRSIKSLA
jgi:hypothetical protein